MDGTGQPGRKLAVLQLPGRLLACGQLGGTGDARDEAGDGVAILVELLLGGTVRNGPMQTVHLPHIPNNYRDELPVFGKGGVFIYR